MLKIEGCGSSRPAQGGMDSQRVCVFFIKHKGRQCRMLVKAGRRYCGQHLVEEIHEQSSASHHKRIPCPLDPKHSCFEHRLEHHLTICNARAVTNLPYLKMNCNLRVSPGEEPPKVALSSLPDDVLLSFISKIERIHADAVVSIRKAVLHLDSVEKAVAECCGSPSMVRHLKQTSSLLAHMKEANLLDTATNPICYVEFGAGRGQLTRWLTEAVTDTSNALFVLIDRSAQRYKHDTKLKYNEKIYIKRIRVDIQHLNLEGVEDIDKYSHIVGFGKHLCGNAADLALRCLCQHPGARIEGAVLALCCHHRCTWDSYCGLEALQDLGVLQSEFYILTALSSWATCNPKRAVTKEEPPVTQENDALETNVNQEQHPKYQVTKETPKEKLMENRYTRLNLPAQYREEVGRKAKQVLDYGRMLFMCAQGFQSNLVLYVTKEATPENVALIVQHEPSQLQQRTQLQADK